jgi:hypothetical protein
VDRRPLLEEGLEPAPAPQDDLSRKKLLYSIEDIVTDRRLVPLLNQWIAEIAACRANACYLAATILLGSLLEGLLLDAAESRPIPEEIWDEPEAKEKNVRKPRTSKDWTLHSLTYVARATSALD